MTQIKRPPKKPGRFNGVIDMSALSIFNSFVFFKNKRLLTISKVEKLSVLHTWETFYGKRNC
jgi:hypothetical protein